MFPLTRQFSLFLFSPSQTKYMRGKGEGLRERRARERLPPRAPGPVCHGHVRSLDGPEPRASHLSDGRCPSCLRLVKQQPEHVAVLTFIFSSSWKQSSVPSGLWRQTAALLWAAAHLSPAKTSLASRSNSLVPPVSSAWKERARRESWQWKEESAQTNRSELVFSGAANCSQGLHSSRRLPWQLFPLYLLEENSHILSQGL